MQTVIQHPNPATEQSLNSIRETIVHNQQLLSKLNSHVENAKQTLVVAKKEKMPDMVERIEAEIRLYQPSIRNIRKTNGELMSLIREAGKWEGYDMTGNELDGLVFVDNRDNEQAAGDAQTAFEQGVQNNLTPVSE